MLPVCSWKNVLSLLTMAPFSVLGSLNCWLLFWVFGVFWGKTYLRAAALCRRPLLADSALVMTIMTTHFFAGFNGTLKAYMKKNSSTTMMMFFDDAIFYPTLGMLIIITMHSHYRQQLC